MRKEKIKEYLLMANEIGEKIGKIIREEVEKEVPKESFEKIVRNVSDRIKREIVEIL